jgi:hypothetical protein
MQQQCLLKHLEKGDEMKQMNLFVILTVVIGLMVFMTNLTANVTEVTVTVTPTTFTGNCPKTFVFIGKITTDSSEMVSYGWKRSDGAVHPIQTIEFTRPGTKDFTYNWTVGTDGKSYSGWVVLETKSPNNMTSNKASFTLKCLRDRPEKPLPVDALSAPPNQQRISTMGCPDPAAYDIRFQIVQRKDKFNGRVRVTGIIKNIGNKTFIPIHHQAKAFLYEMPPGSSTGGKILVQQVITTLTAGAEFSLSCDRDWTLTPTSGGELPPGYRLQILYDPNIYNDTSKNNDDCSLKNNSKIRSGFEINNIFAQ